MTQVIKLPTLDELINESELSIKANKLTVLLNQAPPKSWIKTHPIAKTEYLPIERVEYLLTRIYGKYSVEIKNCYCIANSVVVIVRLSVTNPVTGASEWQDGVGASPIQTDKGAGAMDWNHAKSDGVMKAAPAAESYAVKDAAEKFGKFFGKDLNRKEEINFDSLLKSKPVSEVTINELWDIKKSVVPADRYRDCQRVIETKEIKSYNKLYKYLQEL